MIWLDLGLNPSLPDYSWTLTLKPFTWIKDYFLFQQCIPWKKKIHVFFFCVRYVHVCQIKSSLPLRLLLQLTLNSLVPHPPRVWSVWKGQGEGMQGDSENACHLFTSWHVPAVLLPNNKRTNHDHFEMSLNKQTDDTLGSNVLIEIFFFGGGGPPFCSIQDFM